MAHSKIRKYFVKSLRWAIWIMAGLIFLFILITVLLQFPGVQTRITGFITAQISERTGTTLSIERVAIRFPYSVGLKGIYAEDQVGDTLLYAGSIFVDVSLWRLMRNHVKVNRLELSDAVFFMHRQPPDSVFNFNFLLDAFGAAENKDGIIDLEEVQKAVESAELVKTEEESELKEEIDISESKKKDPFKLSVNRIKLHNIRYSLIDHQSGIDLQISLGDLTTHIGESDLLHAKYHTRETFMADVMIALQLEEPTVISEPDGEPSGIPEMDILVKSLDVRNISFQFASFDGTHMHIVSQRIFLEPEKISLHEYFIGVKEVSAQQLSADFWFPASMQEIPSENENVKPMPEEDGEDKPSEPFRFDFAQIMDWDIEVEKLSIEQSSFFMKNGDPAPSSFFNPSDMAISNAIIDLSDVRVSPRMVRLGINRATMDFQNHFRLENLKAAISLDHSSSSVNIDELSTARSKLAMALSSSGSFLQFDENTLQQYNYDVTIKNTHIKNDFAYFVPAINETYFGWPGNEGLKVSARFFGSISDFTIDSLNLEGPEFFGVYLKGKASGLPVIDSLDLDIPQLRVLAVPKRFFANLPDSLQPAAIELPAWLIMESSVKGNMKDMVASLNVRSDMGRIDFSGKITEDENAIQHTEGLLTATTISLGKILKMEEKMPEPVNARLAFAGTGIKPETMNMKASLNLSGLVYNQHQWNDLIFDFHLADSVVKATSVYEDAHLAYNIDVNYGIFRSIPSLKASLEIPFAQLQPLGFSQEDFLIKTELTSNITFDPSDFFNGHITLDNSAVATQGKIYDIPQVRVISTSRQDNYTVNMDSKFADVRFRGNFSPLAIPGELTKHLSRYYAIGGNPNAKETDDDRSFEISMRLRPDDLITEVLMAGIDSYDTLRISVNYNSQQRDLRLQATWPGVTYGNIIADSLVASIVSNPEKLDFSMDANHLNIGEITMYTLATTGTFKEQVLTFALGFNDAQQNPLYTTGGTLKILDSLYLLRLSPASLLINGEAWNIPPTNLITYGNQYLFIEDFLIESSGRSITIESREHDEQWPLIDVEIRQIDLGRLTDFQSGNFPVLGGLLNGDATLRNIFDTPAFTADLTIDNFAYQGDTLGNIIINAQNPQPELFEVQASLRGRVSDLSIKGNYTTPQGESPSMDIGIELSRLELPTFESFAEGAITDLEGFLSGKIRLTGSPASPLIAGELMVNQTSFRVTEINTAYTMRNEKIVFDRQNIRLQNIALEDSAGRKANINGSINFADLNQLVFDLNLASRNFLLMNLQQGQNDLYHGVILMDSDLRLRGNQNSPVVEGRIKLNEGSNFTFTIPQTNPEAIGDDGVVEFIQTGDTLFHRMALQSSRERQIMSSYQQLEASINVEVDSETDVRIIIDEFAGDFILVEGGGVLSFGIDPGGRISLSGRYEMVDGEYLLTFYDVIRRNFRIQSGSNIVWSGDLMTGDVDITAIYTVRTTARDLMITHMAGSQSQPAAMRQQFPFLVYLKMKGKLNAPEISFEIDLPAEHRNAMDGALAARLSQVNQNESELNKQVFALLILGSFIQDNPFASLAGGGDGFESTARSSASQILTQQLNRLSDRFVRGFDINFEVESFVDFADGQGAGRTELQMEVSRNFFDERMRITVGGNIELEDDTQRQRNPGDIAGDFTIEYLITPDGNLILKGFRTKNYADIFDGQVIETGISLLFSRSYNRFRDLFRKEDDSTNIEEEKR